MRLSEDVALAAQPSANAGRDRRRVCGRAELEVAARRRHQSYGGQARVDAVVQHARYRRLRAVAAGGDVDRALRAALAANRIARCGPARALRRTV
eukprot:4555589-Prymnesium_polylepis.1